MVDDSSIKAWLAYFFKLLHQTIGNNNNKDFVMALISQWILVRYVFVWIFDIDGDGDYIFHIWEKVAQP